MDTSLVIGCKLTKQEYEMSYFEHCVQGSENLFEMKQIIMPKNVLKTINIYTWSAATAVLSTKQIKLPSSLCNVEEKTKVLENWVDQSGPDFLRLPESEWPQDSSVADEVEVETEHREVHIVVEQINTQSPIDCNSFQTGNGSSESQLTR